VARVYAAIGEGEWAYTGIEGGLAFVRIQSGPTADKGACGFRVVDLKVSWRLGVQMLIIRMVLIDALRFHHCCYRAPGESSGTMTSMRTCSTTKTGGSSTLSKETSF
jgi:hypothetical protein